MSNVARSATTSLAELFNTVGVTAHVINTTVGSLGHAADVLSTKTASWSRIARTDIIDSERQHLLIARQKTCRAIAESFLEHKKAISKDPELEAIYLTVEASFKAQDEAEATAPATA